MVPLLQIRNLGIRFKSSGQYVTAVEQVNLKIEKGEILALVGESGSGKSVTALSVLRLLPDHLADYPNGEILFSPDGQNVDDLLKCSVPFIQAIRGRRVSMIFQEPMTSLNPLLTCGQQVSETILLHLHLGRKEAKKQSLVLFEKVRLPHPKRIYDSYPHELSGGQKQRVMIAMAISCRPSLLIADEPTTALDASVQKSILELIRDLRDEMGMGVLFITHDLGLVQAMADRVAVMYKGRLVEEGLTSPLFEAPRQPYTRALIACRTSLLAKKDRLPVVSDFLKEEGIEANESKMPGNFSTRWQEGGQAFDKPNIPEKILTVNHLKVWFPVHKPLIGKPKDFIKAVDGVSFELFRGETLGLVGESGCGKTTLGRALLRLLEPSEGEIYYGGQNLLDFSRSELRKKRKDLQIIFQDPYSSLNPRLSVGNALMEPLLAHGIMETEKKRREKVMEWLEKVELNPDHFNRYPHEFSGGQRQRICIARALILEPGFVVCDESVSALDVSVQAQVLNLFKDLRSEMGFSTIFISHDLAVVHYISQRILVMNKGRIEEAGDSDQIFHHPQKDYTRQLLAAIPGVHRS